MARHGKAIDRARQIGRDGDRFGRDVFPEASVLLTGERVSRFGRSQGLRVKLERRSQALVLRLRGRAGIAEAGMLRAALQRLLRLDVPLIVVDLNDLQYATSLAVSAVAAGAWRCDASRRVRLAGPSASVRRVLLASRAIDRRQIYPSVGAALGSAPAGRTVAGRPGPADDDDSDGRGEEPLLIRVARDAADESVPVPVRRLRRGMPQRLEGRLAATVSFCARLPQSA
jgi:anti-anti-sigma factor